MVRALRIESGSPNNSDIKRRPIGAVVSGERDAEKEIERIPIDERSVLQKQEEAIIDGKRIDSHYRVGYWTQCTGPFTREFVPGSISNASDSVFFFSLHCSFFAVVDDVRDDETKRIPTTSWWIVQPNRLPSLCSINKLPYRAQWLSVF